MNTPNESQALHIQVMKTIIKELQSNKPLILKGGTALMLGYGLDRFSEDLDFDIASDFQGNTTLNLISNLKNIKSPYFTITNINTKKDTDSVTRYMLDYQGKNGFTNKLKIEISYRTPIDITTIKAVEGLKFAPIDKIAQFKINTLLDINHDSRTKGRDLYDAAFIVKSFPEVITSQQLEQIKNLSLDTVESRYRFEFENDKLLNQGKDLINILLELQDSVEKAIEIRKLQASYTLPAFNLDNLNKLPAEVRSNFESAYKLLMKDPATFDEKWAKLSAKIPDMVSSMDNVPNIPLENLQPKIQIQTPKLSENNHDKGR